MNRSLRRLVFGEEEARREKRQRLQLILKQRIIEAAAATAAAAAAGSASSSVASATATLEPPAVSETASEPQEGGASESDAHATVAQVVPHPNDGGDHVDDDEEEEEDDAIIEQQKLLASTTAQWKCLEDSQQAMCIALNRRQTLFAIGEKDGRISIWDNTTIRVITKELDPTSIVLPVEKHDETETDLPMSKRQKRDNDNDDVGTETQDDQQDQQDQDGSVDGADSATNEDGSIDADHAADDDEEEVESVANDDSGSVVDGGDDDEEQEEVEERGHDDVMEEVDETGSIEDNESVDDDNTGDEEDHRGDLDDDEELLDNVESTSSRQPHMPSPRMRKLSENPASVVSIEELKIVKSSLKQVTSIAWSCDSKYLFAGCEEKGGSTRKAGRLCVWDAESAWLLATFAFDAAVNSVSAHPSNPDVLVVCSLNALPVVLNFKTREQTQLSAVPIVNAMLTATPAPSNSKHPSLVVCCKYGASGRFLYCATSKSTVAMLDATSFACLDVKLLPILIQFVDLSINLHETSLVLTSSKGLHEFAIHLDTTPKLEETRLYATGAVRAPWALCAFSSDGGYVVGMPIVRHRHVGESGLYTWHRTTGRVQHNHGVKDGVQSVAWDFKRDALLCVSCVGAIHLLEEKFTTEWPGTMYPAGFRLVTDNELDMQALEQELAEKQQQSGEEKKQEAASAARVVDVFTMPSGQDDDDFESVLPMVPHEIHHISSIPITHVKRHLHQSHDFHIERHFGLGQSVFEPFKLSSATTKKTAASAKNNKKKKSTISGEPTTTTSAAKNKSRSKNSKKRRRF